MLTPEQALEKAKEIVEKNGDSPASNHFDLDELLCEILMPLGYRELIEFYQAQTRWFE
jgi:hypothetical protein